MSREATPTTAASTIPGVAGGYLTADVPGVGGMLRQRAEDFVVDEEPLYEPSGEGEHLYLFVQRRDMSTPDAASLLAKHFGVRTSDVGYAGMKDTRALTRQVFSVWLPGKNAADFPAVEHERLAVLWADRHGNKLRLGHLAGNRFSIKIRGAAPASVVRALRVLRRLEETGAPHFFGEQRFGSRGNNHTLAALDIQGRHEELLRELLGPDDRFPSSAPAMREAFADKRYEDALRAAPREFQAERQALQALARGGNASRAVRAISGKQRRFWCSALQSFAFNRLVAQRMGDGALDKLFAGDIAVKHANGAAFRVDDAIANDSETHRRLKELEISPSGPLWAPRVMTAEGETGRREAAALEATGVTLDDMAAWMSRTRYRMEGERRPLRIPVRDVDAAGGVDEHGEFVQCAFTLPPGAFATMVLREVMKTGIADAGEGGAED